MSGKAELTERVRQLERLLSDARKERDRLERAVSWALGETVSGVESFQPRRETDPPYWWRGKLRRLAYGEKP